MPQNDQSKKLQSLKDKVDRLEKDVKLLKDLLNVQDNWHTEVRDWIGSVVVVTYSEKEYAGTLKWIDRYTLCLQETQGNPSKDPAAKKWTHVFPKSQIVLTKREM